MSKLLELGDFIRKNGNEKQIEYINHITMETSTILEKEYKEIAKEIHLNKATSNEIDLDGLDKELDLLKKKYNLDSCIITIKVKQ